jgi:hypothetical protein
MMVSPATGSMSRSDSGWGNSDGMLHIQRQIPQLPHRPHPCDEVQPQTDAGDHVGPDQYRRSGRCSGHQP